MAIELRKTGISIVGDVPWSTHFCHFYETQEDLLDTLVPYFKAGLDGNEFCVWVISGPLTEEKARAALRSAVPAIERCLADGRIEILLGRDWYLGGGTFDLERVTRGWHEKLDHALARGHAGMRVSGSTGWLEQEDWNDFCAYEQTLDESIAHRPMIVLCNYSLAACRAAEILDVARTHQFALAKRHGSWDVVETSEIKHVKAELEKLNEELERRVEERTRQLTVANEELRREVLERTRAEEALRSAQADLAHVARVMTMGELTASIAHEVNQPLAAVIANGHACRRWLAQAIPDLDEARAAVERVIRDGNRASEVLRQIRALSKRTDPQKARLDLNEVIHEVVALLQSETRKHLVPLRTDLSSPLPPACGDRVQLQQVILNLIMNGIEASEPVTDRPRELVIRSRRHDADEVLVAVQDRGVGLDPRHAARLFDAFFTTKPTGMGMGLSISRSIIEAHGGRLWASANAGPGATFQFTLPMHG